MPVSCAWMGENGSVIRCCGLERGPNERGPKPDSEPWPIRFSGIGEDGADEAGSVLSAAGATLADGPNRGVKPPGRRGWACCCSGARCCHEGVVFCHAGRGAVPGA